MDHIKSQYFINYSKIQTSLLLLLLLLLLLFLKFIYRKSHFLGRWLV